MCVLSEKRGDLLGARPTQEADGDTTQEGHHRRPLPGMEGALVLAEGNILGGMHVILDASTVPFERQEAGGPCAGSRLVMP